jgi:formate-dependent nitrite reductase membrane component NrfD
MPVLFVLHSLTTGFALLALMGGDGATKLGDRALAAAAALAATTLVLTLMHVAVMMRATNAARHSVQLLVNGKLRWSFIGGALLAGLVVPFALLCWAYLGRGQAMHNTTFAMLFFALVLRAVGDYTFRYSVLKAGVFEVLI